MLRDISMIFTGEYIKDIFLFILVTYISWISTGYYIKWFHKKN